MNKSVSLFLMALVFITKANASVASPSFECKFPSGDVVLFHAENGVDLTHPLASGYGGSEGKKTIPLYANGSGPMLFSLQIVTTRLGEEIHYSFKDRFFVNDTTLKYFPATFSRNEYVTGEYRNDYTAYKLDCAIQR